MRQRKRVLDNEVRGVYFFNNFNKRSIKDGQTDLNEQTPISNFNTHFTVYDIPQN